MKYPADICTDFEGWGRIHQGHNLDREMLQRDLEDNVDLQRVGEELSVREVYFRLIPRIMWCADYGGCDLEGEWHSHWVEVKPHPDRAMTLVEWDASAEGVGRG